MNILILHAALHSSKTIAAIVLLGLTSQVSQFRVEFTSLTRQHLSPSISDFDPRTSGSPHDRDDAGSRWRFPKFKASLEICECSSISGLDNCFDGDGRSESDNRRGGSSHIRKLS